MAGPAKPSTKDYNPVPAEERIDDGVEEPQAELEENDDEALYTSSAPLLSSRTRGNEPPHSGGQLCWYHRMGSWRPFRKDRYPSWDPPKKRNWRKIIFFSFLGILISAVIGLSVSTGVLAAELKHRSNRRCYSNYNPWKRVTRLPFNKAYMSSNDNLDFVRVYPPLQTSPSSACQAAWNTLRYVPCHEKIWNRSWDNGKQTSLFDPNIAIYANAMCTPRCTQAINRAYQIISSQCTEDDMFDKTNFRGPMSVDPALEDGPVGAISTIARRLSHTCREKPSPDDRYYYQNLGYCAANMFDDWAIVDGMNAGNLEGLDQFESRTQIMYSDYSRYRYIDNPDTCDNLPTYNSGRRTEARRYGPYVNSTTCDWCTMNWFERKLLSWEKGAVKDPKTGSPVSLKQYLVRIQNVGRRCNADAWDNAWGRALRKYKQSGDLPRDWDGNKEKFGNGDNGDEAGKIKKPCKEKEKAHGHVANTGNEDDKFVHIWPVVNAVPS